MMNLQKEAEASSGTKNTIEFAILHLIYVSIAVKILIASVRENGIPLHLKFIERIVGSPNLSTLVDVKLKAWKYFPCLDFRSWPIILSYYSCKGA